MHTPLDFQAGLLENNIVKYIYFLKIFKFLNNFTNINLHLIMRIFGLQLITVLLIICKGKALSKM